MFYNYNFTIYFVSMYRLLYICSKVLFPFLEIYSFAFENPEMSSTRNVSVDDSFYEEAGTVMNTRRSVTDEEGYVMPKEARGYNEAKARKQRQQNKEVRCNKNERSCGQVQNTDTDARDRCVLEDPRENEYNVLEESDNKQVYSEPDACNEPVYNVLETGNEQVYNVVDDPKDQTCVDNKTKSNQTVQSTLEGNFKSPFGRRRQPPPPPRREPPPVEGVVVMRLKRGREDAANGEQLTTSLYESLDSDRPPTIYEPLNVNTLTRKT